MKKMFSAFLAVLLLMMAMVPVYAAGQTALNLFTQWENNGYPDNVTGVFYNPETGNLSILLKENTADRQTEIKSQISDGDKVTFYEGKYSHTEMEAVCAAIKVDLASTASSTNMGLEDVSIGWSPVTGGFGENGKDFRVVVVAKDESASTLTAKYSAQYGDMVVVDTASATQAAQEEAASRTALQQAEDNAPKKGLSNWAIIGIVTAGLILLMIVFDKLHKSRKNRGGGDGHLSL